MNRKTHRASGRCLLMISMATIAACAGEPATTTPPPTRAQTQPVTSTTDVEVVEAGTITLAEEGCILDAALDPVPSGNLTFALVNATSVPAAAHVWGPIDDGHTFDEFAAHIEEEKRLTSAGEDSMGPQPWFGSLIPSNGGDLLDPGETVQISGFAEPGVFGIACAWLLDYDVPQMYDYAGPFQVGDGG